VSPCSSHINKEFAAILGACHEGAAYNSRVNIVPAAGAGIRNATADGEFTNIYPIDAISAYRQQIAHSTDDLRLVGGLGAQGPQAGWWE